jgi:uncharacterized protein
MSATVFSPTRLDVRRFAQLAAQLSGELSLSKMERLPQYWRGLETESSSDIGTGRVLWTARGENVNVTAGAAQSWLHLEIDARLPMQCQRCLQGMASELHVQRSFRFVRDEAEAMAQDDEAEEDLLVASKQFDLLELIEDELIMSLPYAPTHEVCPEPVRLAASSEEFDAALAQKPHAFAALGQLQSALKNKTPKEKP